MLFLRLNVIFTFFILLAYAGCGGSSSSDTNNSDSKQVQELRKIIQKNNLSGDPSLNRVLPSLSDPLAQLGKKLFSTTDLGGKRDSACVSCHHMSLGGGDDLSLPFGVGAVSPAHLGTGRLESNNGPNVPRNSPSTFNVGMLDKVFFWDGRISSLGGTQGMNGGDGYGIRTPDSPYDTEDGYAGPNLSSAFSRFPVTSVEEMRGDFVEGGTNEELRTALAERLASYPAWQKEFKKVYGESSITFAKVGVAIGEFMRTQVFLNSPWRSFVQGNDSALNASEIRGALLFFKPVKEGGANCASCHSGDMLTDEDFHTLGFPQIGHGKGDGENGETDYGRFRETMNPSDMYRFRTPTLLNVEVTGPWGHAGSFTTLEDTIRYIANPSTALENYDVKKLNPTIPTENMVKNTLPAFKSLAAHRARGEVTIVDLNLSEGDIKDLAAFLRSLTDPCVKDRECMAPWIVSDEDDPTGELRLLRAVDGNGKLL